MSCPLCNFFLSFLCISLKVNQCSQASMKFRSARAEVVAAAMKSCCLKQKQFKSNKFYVSNQNHYYFLWVQSTIEAISFCRHFLLHKFNIKKKAVLLFNLTLFKTILEIHLLLIFLSLFRSVSLTHHLFRCRCQNCPSFDMP